MGRSTMSFCGLLNRCESGNDQLCNQTFVIHDSRTHSPSDVHNGQAQQQKLSISTAMMAGMALLVYFPGTRLVPASDRESRAFKNWQLIKILFIRRDATMQSSTMCGICMGHHRRELRTARTTDRARPMQVTYDTIGGHLGEIQYATDRQQKHNFGF